MINFYAQEYVQAVNKYTNVHTFGMWAMESKIEAYKTDLKVLTNQLIQVLKTSIIQYELLAQEDEKYNSSRGDYLTTKQWIEDLESDGALQYFFEGDEGLFKEPCNYEGTDYSFECVVSLLLSRTSPPKVVEPEFIQTLAFSEKASAFADKFFGSFMDYYMMSRQLNNFDCLYLPTYRALYEFADGVEKGAIFAYFDIETSRFYDEMLALILQIADILSADDWWDNLAEISSLHSAFVISRLAYQNHISAGIVEMETIFIIAEKWLISLYWGVKIISTANIVLTADSQDDSMLLRAGATAPGYVDLEAMPPGISLDRARMLNELHVANYTTQIALGFKTSIAPDFSNFEYIMSKVVTLSLRQTGCKIRMDDLNDLLVLYPVHYL